jgi:hypothetical protein
MRNVTERAEQWKKLIEEMEEYDESAGGTNNLPRRDTLYAQRSIQSEIYPDDKEYNICNVPTDSV